MKKTLLILFSIILSAQLYAQNIEVSVQANSGLFHYSGNGVAATSVIVEGETDKQDYTNNPYGSKNGFSYGGAVQAQYVSKCGFITGLQAAYEVLNSKVDIDNYEPLVFYLLPGPNNQEPYLVPGKGQTFLQDEDIDINPYIGYRLLVKQIKIDLMPGIGLGFNTSSYDKGKVTVNDGTVDQTDLKRPDAPTDVQFKFGIAASYKKFGITAAYAHGFTNLDKNTSGLAAHSELLNFGITYRIF